MASIFLSYSRTDRPKAQQIAEALKEEGFSVWWDKVLRAGQTYDEVTEGMLREADIVIVLWSTVSVKSKWVRAEATLGQRTSVLVPAMIEDAERPIMFELTQSADLIGWDGERSDARWKQFVADLHRAAEQAAPKEDTPAPVAPAPGQAADMTMELTFWTSIKDSQDPADYEAYLKRYPDGHYSDLARNRIAAIARAAQPKPAPTPSPSPSPSSPPSPPPPAPQPKPVAAGPVAPAPQIAPLPPPAKAPASEKKKPSPIPMIAGGIAAILLAGWTIASLLPAADDPAEEPELTLAEADLSDASAEPVSAEPAALETPETDVPVSAPEEIAPPPEPEAPPAITCDFCPEVVALAGGTFLMGSPESESGREPIEGPQHEVTLKPFSISRGEITQADWAACADDGGCNGYRPGTGSAPDLPVTSVSWRDANAYTAWLSAKTGQTWRLPTEAEWEYAARGGTTTAYWWGDRFDSIKAPKDRIRPSSELPQNPFGLTGMLGNAREWVADCYVNGYTDAPSDGSAVSAGDCGRRVVRGGSIRSGAGEHRAANRARISSNTRDRNYGFRVVLEED